MAAAENGSRSGAETRQRSAGAATPGRELTFSTIQKDRELVHCAQLRRAPA
jgi:hypothetical protein